MALVCIFGFSEFLFQYLLLKPPYDAHNIAVTYNDIINTTEGRIDVLSCLEDVYLTEIEIH